MPETDQLTHAKKFQESRLTRMGDNLNRLTTLENECYQKDNTIMNLQNEVENLRRALDDYNM